MSVNALETLAVDLGARLKKQGKLLGKEERARFRAILAKVFALLNSPAPPQAEISELEDALRGALSHFEKAQCTKPNEEEVQDEHSVSAQTQPKGMSMGYFEMVSIKVRSFFCLRAFREPVRIARATSYAQNYADAVFARVDKFINVLSKGAAAPSLDAYKGYGEELIKDMPERGLVLHPPKRKKS